jgi:glycerol-3-phosphate dehydrogenase
MNISEHQGESIRPTRDQDWERLSDSSRLPDVLVIGGGATGFACALDALSRGLSVALVERGDFGEGTSSRSTKLIHGGVRYLRQGRLGLVRESLRERAWFFRAAPHLVHPQEFVIPCGSAWEQMYYRAGLAIYDGIARTRGDNRAHRLSRAEVLARVPGVATGNLAGGVRYSDGQFDDARMIICFLRHLVDADGIAINHASAVELIHERGRVQGAVVEDRETGDCRRIQARAVVNATGVYTDRLCALDQPRAEERITASQGIHLVLDGAFLGGSSALMIPKTADGRVLFAVPWHGRVLLGTTDTARPVIDDDPQPLAGEITYLLEHARAIFSRPPEPSDILGVFAGLRPLPKPQKSQKTSAISRDFRVDVSGSGLVSVYGGKWTTCRAMGEAAIDRAMAVAGLHYAPSQTRAIRFAGGREPLSHRTAPDRDWVFHAVQCERARTLPDLLLRRTRLGVLDPGVARAAAPDCAQWMAEAMGKDEVWVKEQVDDWATRNPL